MRARLYALPLVCLLLLLLAMPAAAEDEKTETWVYRKGDVTTEIDVGSMPEAIRKAMHAQLTAKGWARVGEEAAKVEEEVEEIEEEDAEPEAPAKKGDPEKPAVSETTKKDLEELVRRGGTLPGGFVPHGMGPGGPGGPMGGAAGDALMGALAKATGKLLLRYLDAKDDPVKGPIYEEVLRNLAKALVDGGGGQQGMQQMGLRLMGRFMGGMQDPVKGPVYREIMGLFSEVMSTAMRGPMASGPRPGFIPGRPGQPGGPGQPGTPGTAGRMPTPPGAPTGPVPVAGPFKGAPRDIGGAVIVYMLKATGPGQLEIEPSVASVPAGSPAAQAGLAPGDRIEEIDGKPVDAAGLIRAHKAFSDGGKLTLRLRRKDGSIEEMELEISLEEAPADDR